MGKKEVYKEIEAMLGIVPEFFKLLPESSLELEWNLMKKVQMEPGPIPNKYRELMGLGIAAITKCKYCTFFHTEFAKLDGATPEEIEDAVHFAKSVAGWSTYLNGMQVDYKNFKSEILKICEHVKATSKA